MENNRSRIQAWLEAARPKTLPASFSPVLVGCALAYRDGVFKLVPAILCVLVALLAQIASNFANDYFDFKKGADKEDRLLLVNLPNCRPMATFHIVSINNQLWLGIYPCCIRQQQIIICLISFGFLSIRPNPDTTAEIS